MSTRRIESACFLGLVIAALLLITPCLALAGLNSRIASEATEERLFSIEVREADISDVLRALAQQSGLNIILGEGVAGKVSVSFRNIPFDKAMEMIIKANGLMYTVQNDILWVGKKVDISDEMRVEIIRLNNADPTVAVQQLKGIVSETGTAFADQRTNSVILRDLPRNIDQARRLLIALDTQASQVVIEARIVEASNTFARQIGVRWGPTYTGRNSISGSDLLPETPSGDRNFAVNLPATNPTAAIGLVIGSLSDKLFLDLELSAAESRGDLKIISSPKISTVNNKPATIHSGLTFRVKLSQAIVTGTGVTTTTTTAGKLGGLEEIKTGIDLTVTPKISDDGFVLLNINTQKSDPDFSRTIDGIPGVAEKSASTFVLVKDGETAVIGGLYRSLSSSQKSSVPFLSKIPVLGLLFRSAGRDEQHEELLVFITPKIVKYENAREVSN